MKLRILSWNINGLRSFKTDMKQFLDSLEADIICFQETKVTRDMLEEPQAIVEGYSSYFSFSRKKTGYSGVATYCSHRATPTHSQEGLTGKHSGELFDGGGSVDALPGQWKDEELKNLDCEGRAVITQHIVKDTDDNDLRVAVINVYCPHVDPEKPERRSYKIRFYELLRQRAAAIRATGCHVIIVGDINTSHKRIDHCDPDGSEDFENRLGRRYLDMFLLPLYKSEQLDETNESLPEDQIYNSVEDNACSSSQQKVSENKNDQIPILEKDESGSNNKENDESSVKLNDEIADDEGYGGEEHSEEYLLSSATDFQVVDTFRYFYPLQQKAFTCWHTLSNSRATNYGTRIDYIFCDRDFVMHLDDGQVLQDVMGSDHCPTAIIINGQIVPSAKIPSSCTKFYPEFQGQQQKLSSYFKAKSSEGNNEEKRSVPVLQKSESLKGTSFQSGIKRKSSEGSSKSSSKKNCPDKQKKLSSFFIVKQNSQKTSTDSNQVDKEIPSDPSDSEKVSDSSQEGGDSQSVSSQELSQESKESSAPCTQSSDNKPKQGKNVGWNFLMKGPKPAPLCPGHKEPAALRTVKKKGPNMNRQFYACARGAGKEGDPEAQCNFFKWA